MCSYFYQRLTPNTKKSDICRWVFKSFADKLMKANKDKCHLLISGNENITINVDDNIIGESICEKLLSVNVDYKLKFNKHLDGILKKAGRKVYALSRKCFT